MKHALRAALAFGAIAVCVAAAPTAARADVIRIALVTADSPADFDNNAALLPEYSALLKKGAGVKEVAVFADAAKLLIGTSSVWASEADVKAITESAEWKAVVAKQKAKTLNIGIYQVR
jgi:hypothetical protein